jgi:hypothetical protein
MHSSTGQFVYDTSQLLRASRPKTVLVCNGGDAFKMGINERFFALQVIKLTLDIDVMIYLRWASNFSMRLGSP